MSAAEMRYYAEEEKQAAIDTAIESKESELWTDFSDPTKYAKGIEETLEGLEWVEIQATLAICGDYLQDHECRSARAELIEGAIRGLIETAIKRRATAEVEKADKEQCPPDDCFADLQGDARVVADRMWRNFMKQEPHF